MSLFGEIVEPGTRTNWEDWEEISDNVPNLVWESSEICVDHIDSFIVVEGKHLVEYIDKTTLQSLIPVNSVAAANLTLYKTNDGLRFLCLINGYDVLKASSVVELLKGYILKSKDVYAVQAKPLAEYQMNAQRNNECTIRCLRTTHTKNNFLEPLEQPNIISGVSAGVLSLREHVGLQGEAFICYIENTELMEGNDSIVSLLNNLDVGKATKPKGSTLLHSNLYT